MPGAPNSSRDQDVEVSAQQWWAAKQLKAELEAASPRHAALHRPTTPSSSHSSPPRTPATPDSARSPSHTPGASRDTSPAAERGSSWRGRFSTVHANNAAQTGSLRSMPEVLSHRRTSHSESPNETLAASDEQKLTGSTDREDHLTQHSGEKLLRKPPGQNRTLADTQMPVSAANGEAAAAKQVLEDALASSDRAGIAEAEEAVADAEAHKQAAADAAVNELQSRSAAAAQTQQQSKEESTTTLQGRASPAQPQTSNSDEETRKQAVDNARLSKQAAEMRRLVQEKDAALFRMAKDKKRIAEESAAREDRLRIALDTKVSASGKSINANEMQVAGLEADKARLAKQAADMKKLVRDKDAELAELDLAEKEKSAKLEQAVAREMALKAVLKGAAGLDVQEGVLVEQLREKMVMAKQQMCTLQQEKVTMMKKAAQLSRLVKEKDAALTAMEKDKEATRQDAVIFQNQLLEKGVAFESPNRSPSAGSHVSSPERIEILEAEKERLGREAAESQRLVEEHELDKVRLAKFIQEKDATLAAMSSPQQVAALEADKARLSSELVQLSQLSHQREGELSAMVHEQVNQLHQAALREQELLQALDKTAACLGCDAMSDENSRLSRLTADASMCAEENQLALQEMAKQRVRLISEAAVSEQSLQDALKSRDLLAERLREVSPASRSASTGMWIDPSNTPPNTPPAVRSSSSGERSVSSGIVKSAPPGFAATAATPPRVKLQSRSPSEISQRTLSTSPIVSPASSPLSPAELFVNRDIHSAHISPGHTQTWSCSLQHRAEGIATSHVFREYSPGKQAVMTRAQAKEAMWLERAQRLRSQQPSAADRQPYTPSPAEGSSPSSYEQTELHRVAKSEMSQLSAQESKWLERADQVQKDAFRKEHQEWHSPDVQAAEWFGRFDESHENNRKLESAFVRPDFKHITIEELHRRRLERRG